MVMRFVNREDGEAFFWVVWPGSDQRPRRKGLSPHMEPSACLMVSKRTAGQRCAGIAAAKKLRSSSRVKECSPLEGLRGSVGVRLQEKARQTTSYLKRMSKAFRVAS